MKVTEFTQDKFESAYPLGIEFHYWTSARNQIIKHRIKKIYAAKRNILEIGCGKGIIVDYLRKSKINCWGIETAQCQPLEGAKVHILNNQDAPNLAFSLK